MADGFRIVNPHEDTSLFTGIIRSDQKGLSIGRVQLTARGLIAPNDLTEQEFNRVGETILAIEGTIQLLIGDWANLNPGKWGDKWEEIAEKVGKSAKTIRNYAYVARQVEMSRRRDNLTFAHYAVVAPWEPDIQEQWLEMASLNDWSVAKMKKKIADAYPMDYRERPQPINFVGDLKELLQRYKSMETSEMRRADPDEVEGVIDLLETMIKELRDSLQT